MRLDRLQCYRIGLAKEKDEENIPRPQHSLTTKLQSEYPC